MNLIARDRGFFAVEHEIGLADVLAPTPDVSDGCSPGPRGSREKNVRVPADAKVTGDNVPFVLIIGSQWTAYEATVALK